MNDLFAKHIRSTELIKTVLVWQEQKDTGSCSIHPWQKETKKNKQISTQTQN